MVQTMGVGSCLRWMVGALFVAVGKEIVGVKVAT